MNALKQYGWMMIITIPLLAYVISLLMRRAGGQRSVPEREPDGLMESDGDGSVMPTNPSFRMTVQDVFSIMGRGTVVTGKIESGVLSVGNKIHVKRQGFDKILVVIGITTSGKELAQAQVDDDDDGDDVGVTVAQAHAGVDVGVLLRTTSKTDVQRGDLLTGPDLVAER